MILHIANKNYSSWSLRPWIVMRQLDLPFEEQLHPFGAGPFDFSPTRKVPCLVDGDVTVWDSLAIVEYLADRFPGVWPDGPARAWARSATAEMHSGFAALRTQCSMTLGVRAKLHRIDGALRAELDRLDALWADGLDRFGGPWLAGGAFTAVDAFFAPVAYRVQTYDLPLAPRSLAYAARLRALPAMRDWERAGLAEPWRDAAHDAEVATWATVTEDLRTG